MSKNIQTKEEQETDLQEKKPSVIRPIHIIWAVIVYLLMIGAILLIYTKDYSNEQYGEIPFGQILFHMRVPIADNDDSMMEIFLTGFWERVRWYALFGAIIIGGIPIGLTFWNKICANIMRGIMTGVVVAFLAVVIKDALVFFGIEEYLRDQRQASNLYETSYADPSKVEITFPEQKKNLIYIFCESMEISFTTPETGGALEYNLIPHLTEKIRQYEDFSGGSSELGGAIAARGATWTVGAIVAETSGLPVSVPVNVNSMGSYKNFMPGATAIGDILENAGYTQVMMMGSKATFGGRDKYFEQHGNYLLYDYNHAVEIGKIPEDYYEFWGFEDAKLFEYAKEELLQLAEAGEPFNLSLLTVDSHFPNGFECELCRTEYPKDMMNAICCSDRQLTAFLNWIEQQDFYKDTVVVVAGDHPNMGTVMERQINNEDYLRKTIFFVMNSPAENKSTGYRTFTTMDIFPTTLAAMGCTIKGNKLGLGVNLYSGEKTLVEQMGIEALNEELNKTSNLYNTKILSTSKTK